VSAVGRGMSWRPAQPPMKDSYCCCSSKNGKDCSTVPDDVSKKKVVDEIRDGAGDDAIAVVVAEEVAEEATFSTHPYPAALIMVDGTCPNARVPGVDSF